MAKTNPFDFIRSPLGSREGDLADAQRAMITTAMVFVMVVVASLFFLVVDQVDRLGRPLGPSRAWRLRGGCNDEALVYRPRLFELREQGRPVDQGSGAAQRGLEDKFDEVMVPTEKVVEVRRGRKVDTERKFFPATSW